MDIPFGSIMHKIFGPAPVTNTPPVNPNLPAPGNPSQVANPTQPLPGSAPASAVMDANGLVPAVDPNKAVSPLDDFAKLWETVPVDPTKPVPSDSLFSKMDPKKVMEAVRKQNFTQTLTPELLARVAKGGEDGVKAMVEAIGNVGQNVFGQSAMSTAQIVDKALTEQASRFEAQLPTLVRKFSANENVRTENPLMNHPAAAPLVSAATEMVLRKNPNATTAEIQEQVNNYFSALGTVFAPKPAETPQQKQAAGETDWSKFLQ